ncbi:MAG: phosphonate C-P lyase system protein PhnL [Rhodospirillales bacterium]|nr:phosphonate C-P lyase system protein PhnL [Rhodospirillales bacterium]
MPTPKSSLPPRCELHSDVVLELKGLGKAFYLHEQSKSVPSASDVSLEVAAGTLVALVGLSGAGKSSLLKSVYRTYLPTHGRILYTRTDGQTLDLATAPENEIIALREREIGFVTQFLHCLPRQSTLDVVARPLLRLGVPLGDARERARTLLNRLGVLERLHDIGPATFSGGERQRVNIARGLIVRRRLLLLDEPTASLDAATRDKVIELVREEKAAGVAILAVFHDTAVVAALADQRREIALPTAAALASEVA